jgi:hypothetical protein
VLKYPTASSTVLQIADHIAADVAEKIEAGDADRAGVCKASAVRVTIIPEAPMRSRRAEVIIVRKMRSIGLNRPVASSFLCNWRRSLLGIGDGPTPGRPRPR